MDDNGRGDVNKQLSTAVSFSCCKNLRLLQEKEKGKGPLQLYCLFKHSFVMAGHLHSPRNRPRTRIEDDSSIEVKMQQILHTSPALFSPLG